MIGFEMGSSLAGLYTMAKISPVKKFKIGLKNDMVANMATFFCSGSSLKVKFLGQPQILREENLASREL
jgi:hypothetical protein